MNLVENSTRFELIVFGYEYPDSLEMDDANWLIVGINVADEDAISWEAKDSCLRAFELVNLRDWFYSILNDRSTRSNISFTENELAFRYEPEGGIDVILGFNFHPKGRGYDCESDQEYVINFSVDEKQLTSMIESVNTYIERFPQKEK